MAKQYEAITSRAKRPAAAKAAISEYEYTVHCVQCAGGITENGTAGDAADKARKHGWTTRILSVTEPAVWVCPGCKDHS